jgi:hypothetical protein
MRLLQLKTSDVVVFPDVELADRACLASLEPLVNAICVKEMHAGHSSNFLSAFILHYAY